MSAGTFRRGLTPSALAVVMIAFAVQGFGYAAVVSALPTFKQRIGLSETMLSGILLAVCVAAAGGSVLADVIAVRWGSRWAIAASS